MCSQPHHQMSNVNLLSIDNQMNKRMFLLRTSKKQTSFLLSYLQKTGIFCSCTSNKRSFLLLPSYLPKKVFSALVPPKNKVFSALAPSKKRSCLLSSLQKKNTTWYFRENLPGYRATSPLLLYYLLLLESRDVRNCTESVIWSTRDVSSDSVCLAVVISLKCISRF